MRILLMEEVISSRRMKRPNKVKQLLGLLVKLLQAALVKPQTSLLCQWLPARRSKPRKRSHLVRM